MTRRVVVTGIGAVSPVGNTASESWEALLAGRHGVQTIEALATAEFGGEKLPVHIGAPVKNLDAEAILGKKEVRRADPFILYSIIAALEAWEQAGLPERLSNEEGDSAGCIIGVGAGGVGHILGASDTMFERGPRRISPMMIPSVIGNLAPGHVGMRLNLRGPNWAAASADASGAHAVGESFLHIREGRCDLMVAGGAEAIITPLIIAALANGGSLSRRNDDPGKAARPFDKDRDGYVLGEGAGILVLEDMERAQARGATILAEIIGYGAAADAARVSADITGDGLERALQIALETAVLNPEDVGYVNAHGIATQMSDRVETEVLHKVFEEHAPNLKVSSTKAATGNLQGAAGGVEAVFCVQSLMHGKVPPTLNLDQSDSACDLDYVANTAQDLDHDVALSLNAGYGGTNTAILFAKPDA